MGKLRSARPVEDDISARPFKLAFSYAGREDRNRNIARKVYSSLVGEDGLAADEVFFDEQYRLAYVDLVAILRGVYYRSEVVVVFLCAGYDDSPWCAKEWQAIKHRIEARDLGVIIARLDETPFPTLEALPGVVDARKMSRADAARAIVRNVKARLEEIEHARRYEASAEESQPAAPPLPRHFIPQSKPGPPRMLFLDALGQWDSGLRVLGWRNDAVMKIERWEIFGHPTPAFELESDQKHYKLAPFAGRDGTVYSPDEWLFVFVSPLTLAAKWRLSHRLKAIGPAFATRSDISAYVPEDVEHAEVPRIGIIENDITSTVMLKMLLCLGGNYFHKRDLRLDYGRLSQFSFRQENLPGRRLDRVARPADVHEQLEACILTRRERLALLKGGNDLEGVRHIIDVDPAVADFLNVDAVPRAVYCIHGDQYDQRTLIEPFLTWLGERVRYKKNWTDVTDGVIVLDPKSQPERDAQEKLLEHAAQLVNLDYDPFVWAQRYV